MPYFGRGPSFGTRQAAVTAVIGLGALGVVAYGLLSVISNESAQRMYGYDDDAGSDILAVCTSADGSMRVDESFCGDYGDDGSVIFAGGYHYMVFDARTYKGDIPAVGKKMPVGSPAGYVRTYKVTDGKITTKLPDTGGKVADVKGKSTTIQRGGFGVPNANTGSKAGTSGSTSGGTVGGSKSGTSGGS